MVGDGVPQFGNPGARRILVAAGPDRVDDGLLDDVWAVDVRKSLAQIDRSGFEREC